jgi:biotin synthase-related radical SAM superfamily protein
MSENNISDAAKKKAQLIHYGRLYVPDSIELPYQLSSSTAGPGAGKKAFALAFEGTRLKLGVSKNQDSLFSLSKKNDGFQILKGDDIFVKEVKIIPTLLHAPNQAFVNIRDGCIYNCEFCATPKLSGSLKKDKSQDQVIQMIMEASKNPDFQSVAITSGIAGSPKKTLDEMVNIIQKIRENLKDIEIGVEPYVMGEEDLKRLYSAGATEIKINIETFDREIFKKICTQLDYDHVLKMLVQAVSVFGKGRVTTNILIGLGESDESVFEGINYFAERGIVPVIRVLRINDVNYSQMVEALGHDIEKVSPERMLDLAVKQKKILTKYDLTTETFETMCHKCGCCDIVPFKDI